MAVTGIALIMMLVLAFIFVGISAFSIGGSFGAVVNSIIPIAGGTAVSTSKSKEKDGTSNENNYK